MLAMSKLDENSIWKIVKDIRKSLLIQDDDQECQDYNTLLSSNAMNDNINALGKRLNINETVENLSLKDKNFTFAARIFTYINFCPSPLHNFIKIQLKSETPANILLSLTSIMRTTAKNAEHISSAKKNLQS